MRKWKDLSCRINGGSGFPAAIRTAGVKTIRGWKAAPTRISQMPLVLTAKWVLKKNKAGTEARPVFLL